METNNTFKVIRVTDWNYVVSRVLGASKRAARDTPKALAVKCNACDHQFVARESSSMTSGTFFPLLGSAGAVQIYCPHCEANGNVDGSAIPS